MTVHTTSLRQELIGARADWQELTARYRPVIEAIREGNPERERHRTFPYQQVQELIDVGFSRLRVPVSEGGDGASLSQTFVLLVELAEADANVAHVFRNHLAFVEDRLNDPDDESTAVWLARFRAGDFVGGGWTEKSNASFNQIGTSLVTTGQGVRVTGRKFYATGSAYADWLDVIGRDEDGELLTVLVSRHQDGVVIDDDWEGFGQQTTSSGSASYENALADEHGIFPAKDRFIYQGVFYQSALLAVLVGIARAAFNEGVDNLRGRRRNYPLGIAEVPAEDALLQQKIGHLSTRVYQAEAALEKLTATIDQVAEAVLRDDQADIDAYFRQATIQTHQTQTVIIESALEVTTLIFDSLGASATYRATALDRHWRNARTLASHNPRTFKERILGDHFINGTEPFGDSPYGSDQGQGV